MYNVPILDTIKSTEHFPWNWEQTANIMFLKIHSVKEYKINSFLKTPKPNVFRDILILAPILSMDQSFRAYVESLPPVFHGILTPSSHSCYPRVFKRSVL